MYQRSFAVCLLACAISLLYACGLSFAGKEKYGADSIYQSLNVSIPADTASEARLPAVVFIHGGYWSSGDLLNMNDDVSAAVRNGFVGVTINYRYATTSTPWPAQIQDAKCAIRYIKANAARFHIDPNRVAVAGFSAGAHLALVTAFSQGVSELEDCAHGAENDPALDSSVVAVVSRSGIANLESAMNEDGQASGGVRISIRRLIGAAEDETAALRVVSPTCYVDQLPECLNAAPQLPVLQIHGANDTVISPLQPQALQERLQALGYPGSRYVRFCNQEHTWSDNKARAIDISMIFLREQLLGEPAAPDAFNDVGC